MLRDNFLLRNIRYLILFFFLVIFIICWPLIDDYGVTLDDFGYYTNGYNSYLYAKSVFESFFDSQVDTAKPRAALSMLPTTYELFLISICKLLNINDIKQVYLAAHRINFLLFFLSLIVFFKFIQKRFENKYISFLGVIFFILSPRIFAESFYNSRDIFFMCLFIFYLNSLFNFLNKKNLINIIFFSFFTALLINSRILGLLPVFIFSFIYIYNFLNDKQKFIAERKNIFLYFIFSILFIYIFWPFLWNNPFNNIFFALSDVLKTQEGITIINFYFGKYIASDMMPWHYRLVWFFVTTPLIILLLFLGGIIISINKSFQLLILSLNDKFHLSTKEFTDIFFISIILLSFFIFAEFNKSQYGGWRHLYFIYPLVIYFSLGLVNIILKKKSNLYKYILFIFIFLNLSYNLYWSIKYHPHQYVFFNLISKHYANKNFDLDWWGISHKSSLEYILKDSRKDQIKVFTEGFSSLQNTYLFLDEKSKKKISIVFDLNDADYIIDSKMKRVRVNNILNKLSTFNLIYELNVDGQPVNGIYKKIGG